MKQVIKIIIISVLIGFVAFPTIALGGTFVSSLIQGKTIEEAIQILAEQIDSLIGRVTILESRADKEVACRKANELKLAPQETKIAYYTEQSNQPIYASWAPDTTEELLEYFRGYMQNYEKTGGSPWLHIPDYTPELVQKYIPILEERQREYFVQQELCK
ncbi:hypothetical protein KKE19_02455 [Patescibacteria group bacterium]|nr:hypothetical protein [Patescibacteria group bacterium]MBU4367697.1 hypothetical protein [Patescibacteria group bacterium]MBU4461853.1 hypothetical protein [Patescibacteria group bacterium]MCG2700016.1 hypothetical protein [Candidatus Parcubacteria bacterium]